MPSQPDETPDQDLAHVIQFAQLAALVVCDGRPSAGKRNIILTIEAENNLLDLLQCIEARAKAATAKLSSATSRLYPPMEQIAREDAAALPNEYIAGGGPSKLLRYYWCGRCSTFHWEDERADYDNHILHQSRDGIQYGHRPALGLLP